MTQELTSRLSQITGFGIVPPIAPRREFLRLNEYLAYESTETDSQQAIKAYVQYSDAARNANAQAVHTFSAEVDRRNAALVRTTRIGLFAAGALLVGTYFGTDATRDKTAPAAVGCIGVAVAASLQREKNRHQLYLMHERYRF